MPGGSNGNRQIQGATMRTRRARAEARGESIPKKTRTDPKGEERGRMKEVVKGDVVEGEGYRRRTRRRRGVVVVVVVVVFCERVCAVLAETKGGPDLARLVAQRRVLLLSTCKHRPASAQLD